jgi:cytoskeletal protein CcmA (bactofilin family)
MARRDDVLGVTGADTVIGAGVTVKGTLTSESDMVIDGLVTGNVTAAGDVTIGVNGRIKGDVQGLNVTVAGELEGDIRAEGEATIRETGRVHGDVTAAGLAITSGGLFNGRSTIARQHELELPQDDEA